MLEQGKKKEEMSLIFFFLEETSFSVPEITKERYNWVTQSSIISIPVRFPFEAGNKKTYPRKENSLCLYVPLSWRNSMCFDVQKLGNTHTYTTHIHTHSHQHRLAWIEKKGPYRWNMFFGWGEDNLCLAIYPSVHAKLCWKYQQFKTSLLHIYIVSRQSQRQEKCNEPFIGP